MAESAQISPHPLVKRCELITKIAKYKHLHCLRLPIRTYLPVLRWMFGFYREDSLPEFELVVYVACDDEGGKGDRAKGDL